MFSSFFFFFCRPFSPCLSLSLSVHHFSFRRPVPNDFLLCPCQLGSGISVDFSQPVTVDLIRGIFFLLYSPFFFFLLNRATARLDLCFPKFLLSINQTSIYERSETRSRGVKKESWSSFFLFSFIFISFTSNSFEIQFVTVQRFVSKSFSCVFINLLLNLYFLLSLFFWFNRTRSDCVCPSRCPTIARLYGGSAPAGRLHRSDVETGPTAKPTTMGRATVKIAGQLHRFGCSQKRRLGPIRRRRLDWPSARPYRMLI